MKKWIVRSIVSTLFLAAVTVAVEFIVRSQDDSNLSQERRALLVLERTKILSALDILNASDKANLEKDKLCKLYNSGLIKHEHNAELLYEVVGKDLRCTKNGYITTMQMPLLDEKNKIITEKVKDCINKAIPVENTCVAYDKAGIFGTPRGRCGLKLEAGAGRFFAQQEVTVISERYRRIKGPRAKQAMSPIQDNKDDVPGGLTISFVGAIGCINTSGTGKTCRSTATVEALSFPIKCKDVRDQLSKYVRK